MNEDKIFTGFAKMKQFQSGGQLIQLSWQKEDFEKLANYFNDRGYLNVDLKFTRAGKPYMEVNTYGLSTQATAIGNAPIITPKDTEDDLPI